MERRIQRRFKIANMALESTVKVKYTQNITQTTLTFFDEMCSFLAQWFLSHNAKYSIAFNGECSYAYSVYAIGVKGQRQKYIKICDRVVWLITRTTLSFFSSKVFI